MDGVAAPTSSSEDQGDDAANESDEQLPSQSQPDQASPPQSENVPSTQSSSAPLQKRRRVTRACDECRRKKIKCDGTQPCTHCTVYSYGQYSTCVLFSALLQSRSC